jgi:sRNA-binding carbon storage regulator CsrA
MMITLSPGEAIRIGAAVTLTVLAVEGGRVRLGLETTGANPGAVEVGKDGEQADLKHRWNEWELN